MNTSDQDVSREGLTIAKIREFARFFYDKKSTEVFECHISFSEVNFQKLKELGFSGIILDIDDTIAFHHGEIIQENIEIIKNLILEGWKIVIFSNMKKTPRYEPLEKIGVGVITSKYAKPDPRGFKECLANLGIEAEHVVAIGDNFLTDGGARNIGISFIKIQPLRGDKNRSLSRRVHIAIQSTIDMIAQIRGHI